jgi:hypothetical protein
MPNLYIFMAETDTRIYKFQVFADSWVEAKERRDQILSLYQNHAARLAYAMQERRIVLADERKQESNEKRLNEVEHLKSNNNLKFVEEKELRQGEMDREYYGRHMGPHGVGIIVIDRSTEEKLDDFDLKYTEFEEYPEKVNEKIQKLSETNILATKLIDQYHDEFFKLNSQSDQYYYYAAAFAFFGFQPRLLSVIKLADDEFKLYKRYIKNRVDFDSIDIEQYKKYSKVRQVISTQQALNTNYPASYGISPLMELLSQGRKKSNKKTIPEILEDLKTQAFVLINQRVNVNAADICGCTPLMYLVLMDLEKEQFVKLLLDSRADPTIKDTFGKTALDYFKGYAEEDHGAIQLLEKAIAERGDARENRPVHR